MAFPLPSCQLSFCLHCCGLRYEASGPCPATNHRRGEGYSSRNEVLQWSINQALFSEQETCREIMEEVSILVLNGRCLLLSVLSPQLSGREGSSPKCVLIYFEDIKHRNPVSSPGLGSSFLVSTNKVLGMIPYAT